jgi:hypothetical protein
VSLRGTSSAPSTLNSLVRKLWSIRRQSNDTRLLRLRPGLLTVQINCSIM